MFSPDKIRQDFPLLQRDNPPVFLDSACGALKPKSVIKSITDYYQGTPFCAGRSSYRLAEKVADAITSSRQNIANFLNTSPDEIIFTKNTTDGINLITNGLPWENGDSVLTSDKEHNSNWLPWVNLSAQNVITHKTIPTTNGYFSPAELDQILTQDKSIRLISLSAVSNLDGILLPLPEISKIIKKHNRLFLLDAAGLLLHEDLNLKNIQADFVAFSGTKIAAGTGIGILFVRHLLANPYDLKPTNFGGGAIIDIDSNNLPILIPGPEQFEAGLQNYSGIIGLNSAINWLQAIERSSCLAHTKTLYQTLRSNLLEIPESHIVNDNPEDQFRPIISWYHDRFDSNSLSIQLDMKHQILTRSGLLCNHSYIKKENLPPLIRFSLAPYNTLGEIDILKNVLKKILS